MQTATQSGGATTGMLSAAVVPKFVVCQQQLRACDLSVSRHLCSGPLSAPPGSKVPVHVLITVHGPSWSAEQHVLSHGPQHSSTSVAPPVASGSAQEPGVTSAASAPSAPAAITIGPFTALAVVRLTNAVHLVSMQHGDQLRSYLPPAASYDVVLQEQVGPMHCIRSLAASAFA